MPLSGHPLEGTGRRTTDQLVHPGNEPQRTAVRAHLELRIDEDHKELLGEALEVVLFCLLVCRAFTGPLLTIRSL